jgi:hypothetical protein
VASCVCSSFLTSLQSFSDVKKRIEASAQILKTLEPLERGDWRNVYRCHECTQVWAQEYPFSEHHGGGSACLYAIQTDDPTNWLKIAPYLTGDLRRQSEDEEFWKRLGNVTNSETCKHSDCNQLALKQSSMCRRHHFEMAMGRAYAGPEA